LTIEQWMSLVTICALGSPTPAAPEWVRPIRIVDITRIVDFTQTTYYYLF
jgi:hypothetical protein